MRAVLILACQYRKLKILACRTHVATPELCSFCHHSHKHTYTHLLLGSLPELRSHSAPAQLSEWIDIYNVRICACVPSFISSASLSGSCQLLSQLPVPSRTPPPYPYPFLSFSTPLQINVGAIPTVCIHVCVSEGLLL